MKTIKRCSAFQTGPKTCLPTTEQLTEHETVRALTEFRIGRPGRTVRVSAEEDRTSRTSHSTVVVMGLYVVKSSFEDERSSLSELGAFAGRDSA